MKLEALMGKGSPLLLLHGYPQTRMLWLRVAPALAEHFSLIIPDLRGYSRSKKPASMGHALYSKRKMARDQVATMAALGLKKFFVPETLIGNSGDFSAPYDETMECQVLNFCQTAWPTICRLSAIPKQWMRDAKIIAPVGISTVCWTNRTAACVGSKR